MYKSSTKNIRTFLPLESIRHVGNVGSARLSPFLSQGPARAFSVSRAFCPDSNIDFISQRPLVSTVAHRGKTQLNFSSRTKQSFSEHNNLFQNTTMSFRTQHDFLIHNSKLTNNKNW